jgi:hypothetical protein
MGPGRGSDAAGGARETRGKGGVRRRPVRNVVSFSMRLAYPALPGTLLQLAAERDRVLIDAVTRVAVASLGRQRLAVSDPPAAPVPYTVGTGPAGGTKPRSA